MKQRLRFLQNKAHILILVLFATLSNSYVFANSDSCVDVKLIFARGSSDNPEALFLDDTFSNDFRLKEKIPGAFFQNFKTLLDRDYPSVTYDAVSVHNFPDLYNSSGYRAVGIFGPKTVNNIFEAELFWWPAGEYRDSVTGGVEELSGYLKDEIINCPDQLLVIGGYSQGAHVTGDTLFKLSNDELSSIDAIALFGDPKYIGSDTSKNPPIDYLNNYSSRPKASLWKRGTASLIDRGILDARVPYVPSLVENKTLSWCFNDDFICAGGSGILQSLRPIVLQQSSSLTKDDLGAGHKRYVTNGVPDAVNEIIQRLSPRLRTIEASKGGKDVTKSPSDSIPVSASTKPIDIMIMLNTSAGVDDVLGQLRNNTISVLPPLSTFYSNVFIGVGEYSETGETTNRHPRSLIRQQPTNNYDTLILSLNRKLSYGGLSGGGLDPEDPHQLGIEKAIRATNWREDAEKHVIIITERPMLTSMSFNLCDSSSISGFGIDNTATCFSESNSVNRSSKYHSEWCSGMYEILTQELCTFPGLTNWAYKITRTKDSVSELMEASKVAVSIVVPHGFKSGVNASTARPPLQALAQIGGGLYLEYGAFTKPNYTDMLWKVMNHQPNKLGVKHIQDFDSSNSIFSESKFNTPMQLFTNSKQLFSASTDIIYESYYWDMDGDGIADEVTSLPQIEYAYSSSFQNRYVTLTATTPSASTTTRIPIAVVEAGSSNTETGPNAPSASASRNQDGSVTVIWECSSADIIMLDFDDDQMPDLSAPCSQKSTTIQEYVRSNISLWAENYIGKSTTISVVIADYIEAKTDEEEQESIAEDTDNNQDDFNWSEDNDKPQGSVEYYQELKNNTEKIIKVLQQTQSQASGNNTNTYNPQKTQSSAQQTSRGGQQSASLEASTLAGEFDNPTTPTATISNTDGLVYFAIFAVLPIIIIIAKIKLRAKK